MAVVPPVGPYFTSTLLGDCGFVARGDVEATNRSAAFLGSLLPAALAIIMLSTPRLRRQWSFRILTFAVIFAFVRAIISATSWLLDLETVDEQGWHYSKVWLHMYNSALFMHWYLPWICDCAMLCKVLSFHPSRTTPWRKRLAIIAFPLAMHIPRFPLILVSAIRGVKESEKTHGIIGYGLDVQKLKVTESALQLGENFFCSGFLLYKSHQFACADYARSSQRARNVRRRLRYLTESTLFTFVPVSVVQLAYFSVALVVLYRTNPGLKIVNLDKYLRIVHAAFSLHFGLLAVWWTSKQTDGNAAAPADVKHQDMSLMAWILGPLDPEPLRVPSQNNSIERSLSPVEETDKLVRPRRRR